MSSLRRLHLPTKTTICKLRLGVTVFHSSFCCTPPNEAPPPAGSHSPTLTDEELTKINHLIPRLCDSNQLPTALRLTTIALLANPPLQSLHLSPLIHSLTSHPDLTHTMSLLTHLLHTPQSHPYISPISLMLLSSYLQSRSSNHALKLLRWLQRPGSPCPPNLTMYRLLIPGLCRDGLLLHAVTAFRDMVATFHIMPCPDSTQCLYRGSSGRLGSMKPWNSMPLFLVSHVTLRRGEVSCTCLTASLLIGQSRGRRSNMLGCTPNI